MDKLTLTQLEAKCAELGIDPKSILQTPCDGRQAFQLRMTIELLQKEKAKGEEELKRQIFFRNSWQRELEETKTKLLEAQFRIQELELVHPAPQQPTSSGSVSSSLPVVTAPMKPGLVMQVDEDEEETEIGNVGLNPVGGNVDASGENEIRMDSIPVPMEGNSTIHNEPAPDSGIDGVQREALGGMGSLETKEQQRNAPGFRIPDPALVPAATPSASRPKSTARATTPAPSLSRDAVRNSLETVVRSLIPPPASSIASSVAGGRKHKCSFCDLKLHTKHLLDTHVQSVHRNGKKWICNKCPKTYAGSRSLKIHYDADHLKRRFPCQRCQREYRSLDYMKQHQKKCRRAAPK